MATEKKTGKLTVVHVAVGIGDELPAVIHAPIAIPIGVGDMIGVEFDGGTQARVIVSDPKSSWSRWQRIRAWFGRRPPPKATSEWIDLPKSEE